MPQLTSKSFLSALRNTELFSEARMLQIEQEFSAHGDPKVLAKQLVGSGELTSWQAKFLLSGRPSLKIGNYILRRRLSQDELGDRILAIHHRLDRQVDLQVLPAAANEQSPAFQSFLRHASAVAKLDHPSLIHVYDIDREGGRHYLVSEHFEAQTIDEASKSDQPWDMLRIGSTARQLLAGLAYAHAQHVIHGDISGQSLLLATDGTAKVGNLAVAALSRVIDEHRSDDPVTFELDPQDDYRRLAQCILGFIDKHGRHWPVHDRQQLARILAPLAHSATEEEASRAIFSLDQWLDDHREPEVEPKKSPDILGADPAAQPQTDVRKRPISVLPPKTVNRVASKIPLARIVPVVSLTLLVVLLVWRWYGVNRGTDRAAANPPVSQAPSSKKPSATKKSSATKKKELPGSNETKKSQPVPGIPESELSSEKTAKSPSGPAKPATTKAAEAISDTKPTENEPEMSAAATVSVPSSEVTKSESSNSQRPNATSSEASNSRSSETPDNSPVANAKKSDKPKVSEEPFANTALAVDLPNPSDTSPVVLTGVNPGPQFLLACTLVTNDAVTRRTKFSLEKGSDEQSQVWDVIGQSASGNPFKIAQFALADNELKFQWLADGVRDPTFSYLRNCLLRMVTRGKTFDLRLRQPVKIGSATITAAEPQPKLSFELEGFPFDSNVVATEFLKIADVKFSEADQDFVWIVEPVDQRVPPRGPLHILFSEKQDRFLFVELEAKISKKSEIEATLRVFQNPKPRPYSEKLAAELEAYLKGVAAQVSLAYEQAKVFDAPYGFKEKHEAKVKKLKGDLAIAQSQVAEFEAQKRRAAALFSKPIRCRVYYTLGDVEIDLATWDGKLHPAK